MSSSKEFEGDAGAPLPDFSGARNIQLGTVAPALGMGGSQQSKPDYLDYDQKGRGLVVTLFANAGVAYLMGIGGGGLYGLQQGIASTPSSKFAASIRPTSPPDSADASVPEAPSDAELSDSDCERELLAFLVR